MKKILLLIGLMLIMIGCGTNKPLTLAIGKVDIVTYSSLNQSSTDPTFSTTDLTLRLFSNQTLTDISILRINSTVTYQSTIETISSNIYDLKFNFDQSVSFSQLTLLVNQKEYLFNIGSYTCEKITTTSLLNHSPHLGITIYSSPQLIKTFAAEVIALNGFDQVYLTNTTNATIIINDLKLASNIQTFNPEVISLVSGVNYISKKQEKAIAKIYLPGNSNYSIGYVMVISYNYLGENYQTFININSLDQNNQVFGDDVLMTGGSFIDHGQPI